VTTRVYVQEAWHELRAGLRTSLVPLMFIGLVGYVFMMLANADYLRQMGGADVPRNSPLIVFQMTSGQSFWLIFAWAWVFAQVIARDRSATLHELVLSAPVSLTGLMLARFAGAFALACLLGASSTFALWLVPVLPALGLMPAEAVGPTPYAALSSAYALFVIPSALGLGALYLCAALRTRNSAGPFAVAAVVVLIWMVAMVVLRSGSIDTPIATLIDVTGFGEAEFQTKRWTPHEKTNALLAMTPPLIWNRLAWMALPLSLLGWTLQKLKRESLVLERSVRNKARPASLREGPIQLAMQAREIVRPRWLLALALEARWHLAQTARGWTFVLTLALWTVINVAGAFVHLIAHADGPLVPRGSLLSSFLIDLCYVFAVFVVAGFTGSMSRRDECLGFSEWSDVSPAPLYVRVCGRALAVLGLTFALAVTPTVSAWIVMLLAAPSFEPWAPLLANTLIAAPALLELCAITFAIHALVRSTGTAHALSMFAAFIAIVNHETGMVTYPPGRVGIPAPVALSALPGWSAWIAPVLTLDALKLSCVALSIAVAWLSYPRGTALHLRDRARAALKRLRGGAGLLAAASVSAIVLLLSVLHTQLVEHGGYSSKAQEEASDAAWESRFWREEAPFTVAGGEVRARISPEARSADVTWSLLGVRTPTGKLHGELPHGMHITRVRSEHGQHPVVVEHDHFLVELTECAATSCRIDIVLTIDGRGWSADTGTGWLDESGVWARASDLLPRLGLDPERLLRSRSERRALGLDAAAAPRTAASLSAAAAVAPAGDWRWSVTFAGSGANTASSGTLQAPLDFAVAWVPRPAAIERQAQRDVWHAATHRDVALEIAEDLDHAEQCVRARIGTAPHVRTVLQAPRGLGPTAVHGELLWLPEDKGWDVAQSGVGRSERRASLASALAARTIADRADLRAEPGARWLLEGVAGWLGLECTRALEGEDPWLKLLARGSDRVAEALGALDAPISGLADDGAAEWVEAYAPLAVLGWTQSFGQDDALRAVATVLERVRDGASVRAALEHAVGSERSAQLLGPPVAAEVGVSASDEDGPVVRGERFAWEHGGWKLVSNEIDVVRRYRDQAQPARLARAPATLERDEPFTALDAFPSFERSPLDNVWRPHSHASPAGH
jgi:hypothetical protein